MLGTNRYQKLCNDPICLYLFNFIYIIFFSEIVISKAVAGVKSTWGSGHFKRVGE
jgi:hypothetical protein